MDSRVHVILCRFIQWLTDPRTTGIDRDPACYEPIQAQLATLGCENFVQYEHVNTIGGVCFAAVAGEDSLEAKKALITTFFKIRSTSGILTAAMDAKVQLNPLFPDMKWVKGQWGGGWWRRRPAPAPAPKPPAPSPPAPTPAQPEPIQGPGPAPTPPQQSGPQPDPSVYNWGLDRMVRVLCSVRSPFPLFESNHPLITILPQHRTK